MPCIEARGLHKAFGTTIALDGAGAANGSSPNAPQSKTTESNPPESNSTKEER